MEFLLQISLQGNVDRLRTTDFLEKGAKIGH